MFGIGRSDNFRMKIYYVNGHNWFCDQHGVIPNVCRDTLCPICGEWLHRAVKTASFPYGTLFIDMEMEKEIV
jgi:hypothetical protein